MTQRKTNQLTSSQGCCQAGARGSRGQHQEHLLAPCGPTRGAGGSGCTAAGGGEEEMTH